LIQGKNSGLPFHWTMPSLIQSQVGLELTIGQTTMPSAIIFGEHAGMLRQ